MQLWQHALLPHVLASCSSGSQNGRSLRQPRLLDEYVVQARLPTDLPPARPPAAGDTWAVVATFQHEEYLRLTLIRLEDATLGVFSFLVVDVRQTYTAGVHGPLAGRTGPRTFWPAPPNL